MMGERYTLTLRHEFISMNNKSVDVHEMEPPLSVCFSVYDVIERGGVVYGVNELLHRLEQEFLKRFDGGKNDEQ